MDTTLEAHQTYLTSFHGKQVEMPHRFTPSEEFLEYHNENIFKG